MGYYFVFEFCLHVLIGLMFLAETLKVYLPATIYSLLKVHKDQIMGVYYLYLAYSIYRKCYMKLQ